MIRPRVQRSVVAATASVLLIAGMMAGTASAKKPTPPPPGPTPTPVVPSNTRMAYFGDPASEPAGDRQIVTTNVTAGGVFVFEVLARNTGNQVLTHAVIGLGSDAAARPNSATPSLPAGAGIISATLNGSACAFDADGAACDVGSLGSNASVTARFIVRAPSNPGPTALWASFKVAENVQDQGANTNTFYADVVLPLPAADSNGIATYLLNDQDIQVSTLGDRLVGDPQQTLVKVAGQQGGFVSIDETTVDPALCSPKCIGQEATVNVRNGEDFGAGSVEWTLVIYRTDVNASKGGVIHVLDADPGNPVTIANTKGNSCDVKATDCIVSFDVDKQNGVTTIVFLTSSNGVVRGFG